MTKQKSKIVVISSFDISYKEDLLILTLILIFNKSIVDIIIIGTDTYCATCKLKKVQIFVSIKNLEF